MTTYPEEILITVIDKGEAYDVRIGVKGEGCNNYDTLKILLGSAVRLANHLDVSKEKLIQILNMIKINRLH